MDIVERLCVHDGSTGHPARGWVAAWHDARQELAVHFRECWGDIVDDEESSGLDKFLMVCEYPLTVARKVRVLLKKLLNAKLLFIFGGPGHTPNRQHLTLMFSYSISVLLADCVDPVRGFLLSCASRIVVFAFAPVVGHVLTGKFRHRSLGMANGSFHGDHLLRWVDDNEVCSRR